MLVLMKYELLKGLGGLMERGVSIRAAACASGVAPRTLNVWLALGNSLEQPRPPPVEQSKLIEVPGGGSVTEGQWWQHEFLCFTLARMVTRLEGARVAKLMEHMWDEASPKRTKMPDGTVVSNPGNPGMQMFLFKHYRHVHGMLEKEEAPARARTVGGSVEDTLPDTSEKVVFVIPDNGRGPKP